MKRPNFAQRILDRKTRDSLYNVELVSDFEPTKKQKHAGNYPMLHKNMHGMRLSIENPKGSYRIGVDPGGKKWKTKMHADYGYIRGTEAIDGDHVDIFLGPKAATAKFVHIVDQVVPGTDKFDEHKCMIGWDGIEEAEKAYRANYDKGWKGFGAITTVSMKEFKKWVKSHDVKKPYSRTIVKAASYPQLVLKKLLESYDAY